MPDKIRFRIFLKRDFTCHAGPVFFACGFPRIFSRQIRDKFIRKWPKKQYTLLYIVKNAISTQFDCSKLVEGNANMLSYLRVFTANQSEPAKAKWKQILAMLERCVKKQWRKWKSMTTMNSQKKTKRMDVKNSILFKKKINK